jgi:hypothetical protein
VGGCEAHDRQFEDPLVAYLDRSSYLARCPEDCQKFGWYSYKPVQADIRATWAPPPPPPYVSPARLEHEALLTVADRTSAPGFDRS